MQQIRQLITKNKTLAAEYEVIADKIRLTNNFFDNQLSFSISNIAQKPSK